MAINSHCSTVHNSQDTENNASAGQWVNDKETEDEWQEREIKISEPLRRRACYLYQHRWNLKTVCQMKQVWQKNINPTLGHLILKNEDPFWGQRYYAISPLYKRHKVSLHKCRWNRSHLMWPLNTRNTVNTRFTEGHLANVRLPVLCSRTTAINHCAVNVWLHMEI